MTNRQIASAVLALVIGAAVLNWALYGFVVGKIGPPPPCEVSNTCHWIWR